MTFQSKPSFPRDISRDTRSSTAVESGGIVPLAQIHQEIDEASAALWCFIRADASPHFSSALLHDVATMQAALPRLQAARREAGQAPLRYYVSGSRIPGVFNLGGDLALFMNAIRADDRQGLRAYARLCIEVAYNIHVAFHLPLITISMVQGEALGGGFEAALSADVIVAERSARFGLPEVLFNLFPGMGAMSFLSRRMDAARAEKMILSGRVYTAAEMEAMGIVDVVAEDGFGEETVRDYIAHDQRRHNAHYAMCQARRRVNPVTFEELSDITDLWVDAALRLTESDLRRMARLVAAQARRRGVAIAPERVAAE
jgi:DSF synthase